MSPVGIAVTCCEALFGDVIVWWLLSCADMTVSARCCDVDDVAVCAGQVADVCAYVRVYAYAYIY